MDIVEKIRNKQNKDEMLYRSLEKLIQLYTDKSHFIYELVQNAEDAGASVIRFEQYENRLEVMHNGAPFTTNNLQSLCDIGRSDKVQSLNKIGEFGVGFKSVFGICKEVYLYSHPGEKELDNGFEQFSVKIADFINLEEIEDEDFDTEYTTKFVFPYAVGLSFSSFKSIGELNEVLSGRLQDLDINTLLFMKNLQSISYKIDISGKCTYGSYSLNKETVNDHCSLVSAYENADSKEIEQNFYLVFSRNINGLQTKRNQIDIAFMVSVDAEGKYFFKVAENPYISVYFPTETESKLKFIVQGPFRTTPNRSSVPQDNEENKILAKQMSLFLKDIILELRDKGQLNYSFLNILPLNDSVFCNMPLFSDMYYIVYKMMATEKILPCKCGKYAAAVNVKISRGEKLAELFNEKLLTELINDGEIYYWLPTYLTETSKNYKEIYLYLSEVIKIDVIRPEDMSNFINANKTFMADRDNEWLADFYNFYSDYPRLFDINDGKMRLVEIIKTSGGNFVSIYKKNDENSQVKYVINVFLPPDSKDREIEGVNYVNRELFEKCPRFFNNVLGLRKNDEYGYFVLDYKRRYSKENIAGITDDEHIRDIKKIFYFKNNSDINIESFLSSCIFLKCKKSGENLFVNPSKEKIFFSDIENNMSIEGYYYGICDQNYVDLDFYKKYGIGYESLKLLGVLDSIAVGENKETGVYAVSKTKNGTWHTIGSFRWELNLDKIYKALDYIKDNPNSPYSMEKSKYIFRFLQANEEKLKGEIVYSNKETDYPVYSKIVRILNEGKDSDNIKPCRWLYDRNWRLVSADKVTKGQLNTYLYGDVRRGSQLYEILGIESNWEDMLKEAQIRYNKISDADKEAYFEIEVQRRYGLTVDRLNEKLEEEHDKEDYISAQPRDNYEFPISYVKNWDFLEKHSAEILAYAYPVKYEYKIRRIRTSKSIDNRAYLKNMYRVGRENLYACQMCHKPVAYFEACGVEKKPEMELDPMNLCLCSDCAVKYRNIREKRDVVKNFLNTIQSLSKDDISSRKTAKIDIEGESIWFTQTHIAEIRELLILKQKADKADDINENKRDINSENSPFAQKPEAAENQHEQINSQKFEKTKWYVGKKVHDKKIDKYGKVVEVGENYVYIEFNDEPGKYHKYVF